MQKSNSLNDEDNIKKINPNNVRNTFSQSKKPVKGTKRIITSTIIGFVLILLFLTYLKIDIERSNRLLQEQMNYFYNREKAIDINFNKLLNYQKELSEQILYKELEDNLYEEQKAYNVEKPSPFDHIGQDDIIVTSNRIFIRNKDLSWAEYLDTGSMEPILSSTASGIEIAPQDETDIHVGDIISYSHNNKIIAHRVVRIGIDEIGWYAIAKGDNLEKEDALKIRFGQINGVLIGIIY